MRESADADVIFRNTLTLTLTVATKMVALYILANFKLVTGNRQWKRWKLTPQEKKNGNW